jgi:hypothetical protein
MKKFLTFFLVLTFVSISTSSIAQQKASDGQHFDITVFGAYMWGDYYPAYNAEVKLNAAGYWGIGLGFEANKKTAFEFQYQMTKPYLTIRPYLGSGIQEDRVGVSSSWFLIGSMNNLRISEKFNLFGYGGVGAVYNVPTSAENEPLSYYRSTWSLGVAIQGGFKYWISKKIALRGFLALNMPMQFGGVGFYLGTGGSGLGLNSYSSLFLFNMGGGITFRFK